MSRSCATILHPKATSNRGQAIMKFKVVSVDNTLSTVTIPAAMHIGII